MFGSKKISMASTGSQFSIIADANGTYKGYAIINEGGANKIIESDALEVSGN